MIKHRFIAIALITFDLRLSAEVPGDEGNTSARQADRTDLR
jgi:hypothetical protein